MNDICMLVFVGMGIRMRMRVGMFVLMWLFPLPLQVESSTQQVIRASFFDLDQEFPGDQKAEEAHGQHGKSYHHGKEVSLRRLVSSKD